MQAWKHWSEGRVDELVDPVLREQYSRNEIMRCVHIALLCVQQDVAKRPSMATVVLLLSSHSMTVSMPSKPTFFPQTEVEADKSNSLSLSKGSITELLPR